MTIAGMRALVLVVALAPPPDAGETADVAVAWHAEARASSQLRQRLRREVAARTGAAVESVSGDPVQIARRIVAREVPVALVERARELTAAIEHVEARFRAGAIDEAAHTLARLRGEIEAGPMVPGVAALAWREAVLASRIAWAAGDETAVDVAVGRALALDPEGRPSARDVAPALGIRFEQLRDQLLHGRDAWPQVRLAASAGEDAELTVDGVPGARPVPPGRHFLVAHRAGREPVAVHHDVGTPWVAPDSELVLPASIPATREPAQRLCTALGLRVLVLAHTREDRVGLQAYRCGSGYGPRWLGKQAALAEGVEHVLRPLARFDDESSSLEGPWPAIVEPRTASGPGDGPPDKKPWFKRAWVWVLIGGMVAAGVTTAVVLGTRGADDGVVVDSDDFLQP